MLKEKRLLSVERQAEALAFVNALDKSKRYRLQKVSAKEHRPVSVYIGSAVEGQLQVVTAESFKLEGQAFNPVAFVLRIVSDERIFDSIQTSLIQGFGTTEDGVTLIETLNSLYRLEVLT